MDDSERAWHHTDEDLVKTILEGSPWSYRVSHQHPDRIAQTSAVENGILFHRFFPNIQFPVLSHYSVINQSFLRFNQLIACHLSIVPTSAHCPVYNSPLSLLASAASRNNGANARLPSGNPSKKLFR